MDDSVVKIRVKTVPDANADKGVKEVNQEIVKDTAKTNDEIERLVKEREKAFEKYLNDQKSKIVDWDYSYEKNRYQELFDKYQTGKKQSSFGGYRAIDTGELKFWDTDSKKFLEIPQLYRVELEKALQTEQEIKQVEEQITQEDEKQLNLEAQKNGAINSAVEGSKELNKQIVQLDDTSEKVVKKSSLLGNVFGYIIGRLAFRAGRNLRKLIENLIKQAIQGSEALADKVATVKAFLGSIAESIMPAIQQAIEWVLNAFIDMIRNLQWFIYKIKGVDILANSSNVFAKNLAKAQKSTAKMMKDLMGFDEVAKLSEEMGNSESSYTPQYLSELGQMKTDDEVPGWIKWIYDNRETLVKVAEVLALLWGAGKIAEWTSNIIGFVNGALSLLSTKLGLIAIIAGGIIITYMCAKQVWDDLQNLKTELDTIADHKEEHMKKISEMNLSYDQMLTDQNIRIAAQNGQLEDTESWWRKILGLNDADLKNLEKSAISQSYIYDSMVDQYNQGNLNKDQTQKTLDLMGNQLDTNRQIIKRLQEAGMETEELERVNSRLETQYYAMHSGIKWNADEMHNLALKTDFVETELDGTTRVTNQWAQETEYVRTGLDGTVEVLKGIDDFNIDNKSFSVTADTSNADRNLSTTLSKVWEIITGMDAGGLLSKGLNSIINASKSGLNKVRRTLGFDGGGIVLPQPGHGVPINAVMSERRAEAIIPLENPEAMETLGQAIGKYVNIAIDNVMKVDGRVLATATNNTTSMNNFLRNR